MMMRNTTCDNDWGMMRGDDTNLDLIILRLKVVVVPTGQRKRRLVMASCGACNRKSVLTYKDESRSRQRR